MSDLLQLDAFDHDAGEYRRVLVGHDADKLKRTARALGLEAWRVWNRTKRANKPLLAKPRIVKTVNHRRRWSRVGAAKNETATYKEYNA